MLDQDGLSLVGESVIHLRALDELGEDPRGVRMSRRAASLDCHHDAPPCWSGRSCWGWGAPCLGILGSLLSPYRSCRGGTRLLAIVGARVSAPAYALAALAQW